MLVRGISHSSYLRALTHHELSFFPGELPQNKWFYNQVPFQLDHSMAPALLFPHALLSNPESYLHFHMLKSSLVLKATWSGSSSDVILFPANLSHILHPCASSCVILDESPGRGRHLRSRTTSQKYHVFYMSESPCRSLVNVSWRPHLFRINSISAPSCN